MKTYKYDRYFHIYTCKDRPMGASYLPSVFTVPFTPIRTESGRSAVHLIASKRRREHLRTINILPAIQAHL